MPQDHHWLQALDAPAECTTSHCSLCNGVVVTVMSEPDLYNWCIGYKPGEAQARTRGTYVVKLQFNSVCKGSKGPQQSHVLRRGFVGILRSSDQDRTSLTQNTEHSTPHVRQAMLVSRYGLPASSRSLTSKSAGTGSCTAKFVHCTYMMHPQF